MLELIATLFALLIGYIWFIIIKDIIKEERELKKNEDFKEW